MTSCSVCTTFRALGIDATSDEASPLVVIHCERISVGGIGGLLTTGLTQARIAERFDRKVPSSCTGPPLSLSELLTRTTMKQALRMAMWRDTVNVFI